MLTTVKDEFNRLLAAAKQACLDRGIPMNKFIDDTDPFRRNSRRSIFDWYYDEYQHISFVRRGASICDIGAGPGYTLWFLKRLKDCQVAGVDCADDAFLGVVRDVFGITRHFSNVIVLPRVPTALPQASFDYISAMGIVFDKHWGADEWLFFIDDMRSKLNDDGRLVLRPNVATTLEGVLANARELDVDRLGAFYCIKKRPRR